MLTLAFDTATGAATIALVQDGDVLGERVGRASTILADGDELVRAAGAVPGDLDLIAVGVGPGSFTGVRIGLATAVGFHQALGLPATGISTFEILAKAAEAPDGSVILAAVDALRGEWNVQAFAGRSPVGEPELVPAAEIPALFDRLGAAPEGRVVAGFELDRLAALPGWPAAIRLFTPDPDRPLATVAALRAANPSLLWDPGLLVTPLYSRPPAVTLPRPRVAP
jgi:tRNA threonylcarbamoyladenosine biosynthesis protein TsaB